MRVSQWHHLVPRNPAGAGLSTKAGSVSKIMWKSDSQVMQGGQRLLSHEHKLQFYKRIRTVNILCLTVHALWDAGVPRLRVISVPPTQLAPVKIQATANKPKKPKMVY